MCNACHFTGMRRSKVGLEEKRLYSKNQVEGKSHPQQQVPFLARALTKKIVFGIGLYLVWLLG